MNKYWNVSLNDSYSNDAKHPGTSNKVSKIPYLITQMKVQRTRNPHAYGRRSKYIVRPEAVVMAGNHIAHKFVDGEYQTTVQYHQKYCYE